MKLSRITLFTVLFAAFALALPAFAQDATPEATASPDLQTYKADNGLVSIQFPASWVSEKGNDTDSILTVEVANSQAALDKDLFNQNDVFAPGEVHISVAAISLDNLVKSLPAGTLTADATPLEILQALIKQGMPDTFTFGDPGEITLNGKPAVRMNLTAAKRGEGQILFTVYNQKWLAGILVFAAPGEGDKWDIFARDILNSLHIDPNAELTPEPTAVPPPPTQTYTSAAGNFMVTYPTTWEFVDRSGLTPDGMVGGVFSSNHVTQFKQLYADDFESGDVRVELSLPDLAKLEAIPQLANMTDQTPVTDILQGLVDAKIIPELKYSVVQSTSMENASGAQVNVSGAGKGAGRLLLFKQLNGQFIYLVVYTASGELEAGDAAARLIANSVAILHQPTIESTAEAFDLTQTAKTQNGLASLMYPTTWVSRQYGKQSLYVANSQDALNKSFGSMFQPGQMNMLFSMSTTEEYIKLADLTLNPDVTPLELLQASLKKVGDTIKFGTPEATTVGDKLAARVNFTGEGFEGTAWLIEYHKGATIAVQMLAAPGESQRWESVTLIIAQSIQSTD